jgi:hypothetical protein
MREFHCVIGIALTYSILCVSACLQGPDKNTSGQVGGGDGKVPGSDTAQARILDSLARAADSLRVALPDPFRADLAELAAKIRRLPVPMGTRYNSAPRPAPKSSAAAACAGDADVIALGDTSRGRLGMDTVAFYDKAGLPHCEWQAPTLKETHGRYLFDAATGEARETLVVEITEDDRLPRYRTRGTGTMALFSGLEFRIDRYEVDMLLDNSDAGIIIQDARLDLGWRDGYALRMVLARPKPFRAADLFPAWEARPAPGLIMSGPIMKGAALAGYIDLFSDRTVGIRDRTGARLP